MAQDYPRGGQFPEFSPSPRRGPARPMEPPILSQYPEAPVYELATLVQLVKLRPQTLWAWEQQLGLSGGEQGHDPNGHKRRYSERDLVALLWVRERVIAGETPQEAAARLLAAQRGKGAITSGPLSTSGPLDPAALLGTPLYQGQPIQTQGYDRPQAGATSEQWTGQTSGSLGTASYAAMNPGGSGIRQTPPAFTGAKQWNDELWNTGVRNAAQVARAAGPSGPLHTTGAPQMGGPSGRLGAVYGATLEPSAPVRGYGMMQAAVSVRELRPSVAYLLQAFARFDTAKASAVMLEALRLHGVDNVCVGLVQPTVTRISELWSKSELTNPEERYALHYLRGFLYSVFHSTQEPMGAPFVVVGCAPNETNEFGALLLAVLWRRAGMRVAYLGAGVDGDQFLQQRWPITPALIALTATSPQRIRALTRIGKKLSEQPAPQPIFAYSGSVFLRSPDLKRKLPGVYLGDDAVTATAAARQLLEMDVFGE